MSISQEPVDSLGTFIQRVSEIRQSLGLAKHKELWFRGESKNYGETIVAHQNSIRKGAQVKMADGRAVLAVAIPHIPRSDLQFSSCDASAVGRGENGATRIREQMRVGG